MRSARAQKSDPLVSRQQVARAGNSRFAHNQGCRRARGARAQKPDPPVSRRHEACVGKTRFAHTKGVTRPARAKTRFAVSRLAGGVHKQHPVRP